MIESTSTGVILSVYLQPRASKTEFVGVHGGALKFRVAAPPVDGKANHALCHYLAKLFALPQSAVSVYSGQASRNKRIQMIGVAEEILRNTFNLSKA